MTKRKAASAKDTRGLARLERILLLVPYCVRRPGETIGELAKRFDTTPEEIRDDLNLVFVCGLPDYTPADLIEVMIEEDRVYIRMADYFSRPLRLTRTEAIPLYLKAHALLDLLQARDDSVPGMEELTPLRSAIAKLAGALQPNEGGVQELEKRIRVHLEAGEAAWLPLLRDAVTDGRRVDMEYWSATTRDQMTQRRVDPYVVFASMGHWYVSGYCHLAQDDRMFRLDRIRSLEVTDETFEPPAADKAQVPPSLLFVPGPEDIRIRLRLTNRVASILETMMPGLVETSKPSRAGWKEVSFRTSAYPWLEKLLLQFGREVVVLEPAELRDRVRDGAERILKLYKR